jgi:uncharacterized repeat protein (TIGR01451 family)
MKRNKKITGTKRSRKKGKEMKTEILARRWIKGVTVMALVMGLGLLLSGPAMAADNQGTGDIGGDSASLNSSNVFSLFTTTMSLNKMAFLANGTQLASGATLPRGTEVRFVIYVDNTTSVPLNDVSIQDVLDPAFAYQAGSMKVDNSLSSGATQAVIYSTVNAVPGTMTDVIDGDVASAVGVTITAGNSGGNGPVNVAADSVWAFLFRALMQ